MPGDLASLNPFVRPDRSLTTGTWATEALAEDFIVRFLECSGAFHVYRQPTGTPLRRYHFQDQPKRTLRADVLLTPSRRLREAGWSGGSIVIDAKKSGVKIGPGLNQLADYLNTAWRVPGGTAVLADFAFLYPAAKQCGPLASMMAHNHVGTADVQYGVLRMYCGETRVLSVSPAQEIHIGRTDFGHKIGAR